MAPDKRRCVQDEVDSGRFADREAFISFAVRVLMIDREETLAGIRAGLEDVAAGRSMSVEEVFAGIRQEVNLLEFADQP